MIKHTLVATCIVLLGSLISSAASAADKPDASQLAFDKEVAPLLQKYCYQCHGNGKAKADLALDSFKSVEDILKARDKWQLVLQNVSSGDMPPEDAKAQPTQAERDVIKNWVEQEMFQIDPKNPDPGRVTIHRLNRAEYSNTIRDLVGVSFQAAEDFPSDDSGYGFDNNGDVLSLPPVLMEKYLAAATRVLDEAIVTDPIPSKVRHFQANLMEMGFNAVGDGGDGWMPLGTLEEDRVGTAINVPAGDYIVRVYSYVRGRPGGGGPARGGFGGRGARGGRGRGGRGPADPNAAAAAPTSAPADAVARGQTAAQAADAQAVADAQAAQDAAAAAEAAAAAAPPPPSSQPVRPGILSLQVDDTQIYDWSVSGTQQKPGVYETRVGVSAGRHRFNILNRRLRGGANELINKNGRMGAEQGATLMVKWVEIEGPLPNAVQRVPAKMLETRGEGKYLPSGTRVLDHEGEVATKFNVPKEGDYLLRVQAFADQAGSEPVKMDVRINDQSVKTIDVIAPAKLVPLESMRLFSIELLNALPYVYEVRQHLTPGEKRFSAAFINDFADPTNANPNLRKRNLYVDFLEVAALDEPATLPPMPAQLASYFAGKTVTPQNKEQVARQILTEFTQRAWRRPVASSEVDGLVQLFDLSDRNGDSIEAAMKLPLKAVLVSPKFLFRGEYQPEPDNPKSIHPLDEYSLASRLSYFLWSSMPDDELLGLASRGQLRANLESQVKRMLASPKAHALAENFAGQWLQTRNLRFVSPDKELYPEYDVSLGAAMATETQMFFEYVMRDDRTVIDFLNGDYTFVNDRLANFYGLPPVVGSDFQKVSLKGTPRAGVLTQGSVLVITSNPTRTSPVKRGKWVLENLLGTPPPPPPPNVPELKNDGKPETGSLRAQMEQHRANPACASCHARMDPIGFGLEGFDGIGKPRDKDGEFPIDTAGQLVTGESFKSAVELADILATKKRKDFLNCISEKMLIYAIGRGTEFYDRPAIDQIVAVLEKDDAKFSTLIMEVVKSVPFQMRRGDGQSTAMAN